MSDSGTQLREALSRIAETANAAIHGNEYSQDEDEQGGANRGAGKLVCTPKTLPPRLLMKAAETALTINPVNAPAFGPMAHVAADLVLEPMRIAVLTAKYWGPAPRQLTVSFMES